VWARRPAHRCRLMGAARASSPAPAPLRLPPAHREAAAFSRVSGAKRRRPSRPRAPERKRWRCSAWLDPARRFRGTASRLAPAGRTAAGGRCPGAAGFGSLRRPRVSAETTHIGDAPKILGGRETRAHPNQPQPGSARHQPAERRREAHLPVTDTASASPPGPVATASAPPARPRLTSEAAAFSSGEANGNSGRDDSNGTVSVLSRESGATPTPYGIGEPDDSRAEEGSPARSRPPHRPPHAHAAGGISLLAAPPPPAPADTKAISGGAAHPSRRPGARPLPARFRPGE
jgi:hypothetical protein